MKKTNIRSVVSTIIGIVWILVIVRTFVLDMAGPKGYTAPVGSPEEFYADEGCTGGIEDFAVCDGHLYVHYEAVHTVQIYAADGTYLRSYRYNPVINNGRSALYCVDGTMYLSDRVHSLYRFENGKIVEYLDKESYSEENHSIEQKGAKLPHTDGRYTYRTKLASIYRTEVNGSEECIVQRPAYQYFLQFQTYWTLGALSFGIIVLLSQPRHSGINVDIFHDYHIAMRTYEAVDEDYIRAILGNIGYKIRRTRKGFCLGPQHDLFAPRGSQLGKPLIDCTVTDEDGMQVLVFRFHVEGFAKFMFYFGAVFMTLMSLIVLLSGNLWGISTIIFGCAWCGGVYALTKCNVQKILDNSRIPTET